MKAIDSKVLVRLIIQDDEHQSKKALAYVKKNTPIFISHLVLCELCWVCGSCYELTKEELSKVLENILRTETFVIENSDLVWSAIHHYKLENVDFPDLLIGVTAKHYGSELVGTFDKKAGRSSFFELI